MPAPKKVYVQRAGAIEPKGSVRSTFDTLTSPENRAVVTSIAAFGVWLPLFSIDGDVPLLTKTRLQLLSSAVRSERLSSCEYHIALPTV
jgi:hypothetical protein